MQLNELLGILNYEDSENYIATDRPRSNPHPSTEHLFRAAHKAGVQGTYVFRTSPPSDEILPRRSVVCVAEANTEEEAREIHCKLWNLGYIPFLVVVLPHQIRVYTGFDYSAQKKEQGLISTVNEVSQIEKQLDYLFAESIDSGNIWKVQAENLTVDRRVDVHLLKNLEKLGKRLTNKGLELSIAHALIGKYVYIRYLRDRGILSDIWLEEKQIDIDSVLSRNATLQGLRRIIEVLEERFEGDIFPLPLSGKNTPSDEQIRLVASVFKGDDIETGQLHLDFEAYKFEYIPIELLSSIYEQFLRSQGKSKKQGAIYTPEPLADYMISELNSVRPLEKGMKILDPCCGSGIFLVLAYRRLIEKEAQKNFYEKVSPEQLKEILLESCYGVERNRDACYITEFSLILTMLDYIEPPDLHKNEDFKFPKLHNERVFECDLFDDSSDFWKRNEKFDWIIGNPPFIELKKETKGEEYIRNWMKTYSQKTVTGNRVCEAFTWRVTDLLKLEKTIGYVALLIHAPSLFNGESEKYRKDFFQQHEIRRVTNFSHLARVLFYKRAKVAVATIVYKIEDSNYSKPNLIHYAPFGVNQISNKSWQEEQQNKTWTITINETEIQAISHNDIETGSLLPWKLALWGSYRDKKIIQRLNRLFSKTLGELCQEKVWNITSGLQLKDISKLSGEKQSEVVRESSLIGKQFLDINVMNKSTFCYSVPRKTLKIITEQNCYTRRPGGLKLISAPHLVIHPNFIAYSDLDFVIPDPHVGISGKPSDAQYLQSLTIFLNSSLIKYYLFFVSPAWGIGRHRIDLKPTKKIPVPDFTDKQMNELSKFYLQLEELENSERFAEINQDMIDRKIEEVFNISPNIRTITREFWKVRFSLNEGRIVGTATDLPTQENLLAYSKRLAYELDRFAEGSKLHHKVSIIYSKDLVICTVELIFCDTSLDVTVQPVNSDSQSFFKEIQQKLREKFSQWVYIQRGFRIIENSKIHICKTARLIDWTETQALLDSDDIIAEILSMNL